MRHSITFTAGIVAAVACSASAAVTYVSAERHVTAQAGSAFDPTVTDTTSTTAFGPFADSASASTSEGVTGTAAQSTDLLAESFGGTGAATAQTGPPVGTGWGTGESWFEVTFTLDVPTPMTLTGDLDGFGVYSFTGPDLSIADMSFGPKNVAFDESATLVAGSYTFIISAASEAAGSPIDGSFTLEVTLVAPTCAADIAGPDGPGLPDGRVDALDFLLLLAQWGTPCAGSCEADFTGAVPLVPDGNVDALDFLLLINQWGSPGVCP